MTPDEAAQDKLIQTAWRIAQQCEAQGIVRFIMVDGRRFYEQPFFPRHQDAVARVLRSVKCPPSAPHIALSSVHIIFDEWSLLCPDIAIWDRMPEEQTTPVTLRPQAVIEVLLPASLSKDLEYGVALYQQAGVKDVLLLDPETGQTYHFQPDQPERNYFSPHTLTLACGCEITV